METTSLGRGVSVSGSAAYHILGRHQQQWNIHYAKISEQDQTDGGQKQKCCDARKIAIRGLIYARLLARLHKEV